MQNGKGQLLSVLFTQNLFSFVVLVFYFLLRFILIAVAATIAEFPSGITKGLSNHIAPYLSALTVV